MTGKTLAATVGAVAGYVVYQRQQQGAEATFGTRPDQLLATTPLANVAAATVAAVLTRSAFAGLLVGFALSALGGNRLNELVAQKIQDQTGRTETHLTEVA